MVDFIAPTNGVFNFGDGFDSGEIGEAASGDVLSHSIEAIEPALTPEVDGEFVDSISTGEVDFSDGIQEEEFDDVVYSRVKSWYDSGIIESVPEGFNDREVYSDADLDEVLRFNIDNIKKDTETGVLDKLFTSIDPGLVDAINYQLNGGDPYEYMRMVLENNNVLSLDVEDVNDQELIVRNFYKDQFSENEIEDMISSMGSEALRHQATLLKPKLDERYNKIETEKLKAVEAANEMDKRIRGRFAETITGKLSSDEAILDLKFSGAEKNTINDTLFSSVEVSLPGGKVVSKPKIDALLDYHRYNQNGDPNLVALAALMLSDYESFKKRFESNVKSSVTNKFVEEHQLNKRRQGFKIPEASTGKVNVDKSKVFSNFK
jgi:hypothetical protein